MNRSVVSLMVAVVLLGSLRLEASEKRLKLARDLMKSGGYVEALDVYLELSTSATASGQVFAELVDAAAKAKRYSRATEVLNSIIAKGGPLANQAALNLARIQVASGNSNGALDAIKRVKAPAPLVLEALQTGREFERLRIDSRFKEAIAAIAPCNAPEFRQFDFWKGEWRVTSADGKPLGRNNISIIHDGCVLLEEWKGALAGSGTSFNFYDGRTRQWHQFWVDASGTNWISWDRDGSPATLRGKLENGKMVLTSHPGTNPLVRGTWAPLEDGRVRQTFDQSSDGGKTWSVVFDGYYSRLR